MSTERFRLVGVSAGTSDPSSTRLLADRTADRVKLLAGRRGHAVTVSVIELREIAADITTALVSQLVTPKLRQAITALGEADGIIAATPVYKAGPSGLFTSFFGVLDNDLLIGKPVVLDLSTVDLSGSAITHLVMSLEKRSIRVLGIKGCEAARLTQTMPPLLTGGRHAPVQQVEPEEEVRGAARGGTFGRD